MAKLSEPDRRLLTRRSLLCLVVVLAIGFVCRVILTTHSPAFILGDTHSYFSPAYRFVEDGKFPLEFKRPPVYPLFLTGFVAVWGPNYEPAVAAQHVLGLVGVVLVYVLGALSFSRVTGLLAALGVAISGAVLRMEHTVISESMFAVLLPGSVLAMLLAARALRSSTGATFTRRTGLLLLLTGVLVGILGLTRPSGQAVLALAAVAALLSRRAWPARVLAIGVLGLGYSLVMGPWLLRNYTAHGVATASGGLGDSLYARISRHDPSFDFRDHGTPPEDARRAAIREMTFELSEEHERGPALRRALTQRLKLTDAESDAALTDVSLVIIRQEPLRYVSGTVAMFVQLGLDQGVEPSLQEQWERRADPREHGGSLPERLRRRLAADPPAPDQQALVESLMTFYLDRRLGVIIGLLFVFGAIRCAVRSDGREAVVLPLAVAIHLLAHVALDGPLSRYRYPAQPLITLVAAGGLTWLASVLVWRVRQQIRYRVAGGVAGSESQPRTAPLRIAPP